MISVHEAGRSRCEPTGQRERHAVECRINHLKTHRDVAAPCDELTVGYKALLVAAIGEWL